MDSTNTDKPVGRFLEALGALMIGAGFEWLIFVEQPSHLVVIGFWIGGTAIFFGGAFWGRLKFRMPERFVVSVETVALDFRYWLAMIFVVWLYMFCVTLLQRRQIVDELAAMNNEERSFHEDLSTRVAIFYSDLGGQLKMLRADLDHYVMPRHIEPNKIEAISKYLQNFPAHTLILCYDNFDSETAEYTNQIRTAVFNGGWTIDNCPDPAEDLRKQVASTPTSPITQQQLWNFWNVLTNPIPKIEGLRLEIGRSQRLIDEINKRRLRPDPKNPETDALLRDALKQGDVTIEQWGGGGLPPGAKDEEVLTLTVGPKPRTYHPPMTMKMVPVPSE